jgi:hypothetical protein
MAKINWSGVSPSKRRLVYKILTIYRDCGFLRIYKILYPDDMGKILRMSEYNLAYHLERLERGEPEWMFKFGGNKHKPKKNGMTEPVKKIIRQLTFFVLSFLTMGCFANPPWLQQMRYENHILERYPLEEAMKILANNYTIGGQVALPYSTGTSVPGTPYFYEGFYYKNSIYLQSTYGRRR